MRRIFDICFSFIALLALSPIFLVVALILKLTGEGRVLYIQNRVGINGTKFGLYKFVTMKSSSEFIGTKTLTLKDDPRVLPFGKILRKSKINELPQLANILLGDMSFIGPRPLTYESFMASPLDSQNAIILMKPGLSGIGSIIFRKEEEILSGENGSLEYYRQVVAPYKGQLEKWYQVNQSLITYFTLIGLTIMVVLFPLGRFVWKVLPNLPEPPDILKGHLDYR